MALQTWLTTFDEVGFLSMRILLSVLWQSSILLAGAALLGWVLRRRPASVRCAVWVSAVLMVPLLPVLNWALLTTGVPQAPIPVVGTYTAPEVKMPPPPVMTFPLHVPPTESLPGAAPAGEPMPPAAETPEPSEAPQAAEEVVEPMGLWDYPWLLALAGYVAGTVLFVSAVVVGRYRMRRWVRGGRPVTDAGVLGIFWAAARHIALTRRVRFVTSDAVGTPMTLGTFRPVVLLPAGLAGGMGGEDLKAVAVHELSHVKRHDPLMLSVASAVRAVFFFHPLIWLACRQLSRLSEIACDDAASIGRENPECRRRGGG